VAISVCYIVSNISKALAFEWIVEKLSKEKIKLSFILLNPGDSVLEKVLQEKSILFSRIIYHGKKDLPKAIYQIYRFLKKHHIQVVHCHLFDANIAGLVAAKWAGIQKRIYTRHHSTFHHEYFPRAVWYDRFINYLATDIIAISENVRTVLIEKEKVSASKIHLIYHGFRLEDFVNVSTGRVMNLQAKYNCINRHPVIGVIARFTYWKGIQNVIPAFQRLLKDYPNALLLLANANGDYAPVLRQLLSTLPEESFIEIAFEDDVAALYQLFDVFVHVPINPEIEAFGQTYVEALAAGVPSVFTLSGVASEFIEHERNALVVPFQNSEAIFKAFIQLLGDTEIKQRFFENSLPVIEKRFDLDKMIQCLSNLYLS